MNGTDGINPDTGLPVLPDGQWWRVTEGANEVDLSIMQRVERRGLFGMRTVERAVKSHAVYASWSRWPVSPRRLDEDAIVYTAKLILRRDAEERHRATLYGDYPPKRLGETK